MGEHICGRTFKNNQASRKWVVSKLVEKMILQPKVNHMEAFEYMKIEFGVHIGDTKIFRFLLEDYGHELLRRNLRSTIKIDCIPILESLPHLDGCFLKGYYGGQLLSAIGQDENNGIYKIKTIGSSFSPYFMKIWEITTCKRTHSSHVGGYAWSATPLLCHVSLEKFHKVMEG
ncbi:hypothetical protein CR513_34664, partial [Mucuna pruriens]